MDETRQLSQKRYCIQNSKFYLTRILWSTFLLTGGATGWIEISIWSRIEYFVNFSDSDIDYGHCFFTVWFVLVMVFEKIKLKQSETTK